MANEVYANSREISCKAGGNKVIAAFPDVCLLPPSPPAGPIPIPYPVSSNSADTADGNTTVTIPGKEIMLKDKSHYTKCLGYNDAHQVARPGRRESCIVRQGVLRIMVDGRAGRG